MLVQVTGDAGSGNLTLIHPNVESVAIANAAQHSHGLLSEQGNFSYLFGRCQIVG